jgi:hypothetical protein
MSINEKTLMRSLYRKKLRHHHSQIVAINGFRKSGGKREGKAHAHSAGEGKGGLAREPPSKRVEDQGLKGKTETQS